MEEMDEACKLIPQDRIQVCVKENMDILVSQRSSLLKQTGCAAGTGVGTSRGTYRGCVLSSVEATVRKAGSDLCGFPQQEQGWRAQSPTTQTSHKRTPSDTTAHADATALTVNPSNPLTLSLETTPVCSSFPSRSSSRCSPYEGLAFTNGPKGPLTMLCLHSCVARDMMPVVVMFAVHRLGLLPVVAFARVCSACASLACCAFVNSACTSCCCCTFCLLCVRLLRRIV